MSGRKAITEQEPLPRLQPEPLPTSHTALIGAVVDNLTGFTADDAGIVQAIAVSRHSAKKPVVSTLIQLAPLDNIEIDRPFTHFHRAVYDAICTLYLYGASVFSVDQACRAMSGRTRQEDQGAAFAAAVQQAIDDMLRTRVKLDATAEGQMRRVSGKFTYDRSLLCLDGAKFVSPNGREVWAYTFVQKPVLLDYCQNMRQLFTVPAKLLDIKKTERGTMTTHSVPTNQRREVIKCFLLREIAGMRNQQRHKRKRAGSNVISATRIYNEAEVGSGDRIGRSRTRKYVGTVLDSWAAEGFISGWQWRMRGHAYDAIIVAI